MTALLLILLLAGPAQESVPFAWAESQRHTASQISDALVAVQLGAETVASWRSPDRKAAFGCQALRMGLSFGATELLKRTVKRTRPDGSDRLSFPSGHTQAAAVSSGWKFQVSVPVLIGVGYLRPAAMKHFASDVIVGAGIGLLARKVC